LEASFFCSLPNSLDAATRLGQTPMMMAILNPAAGKYSNQFAIENPVQ